MLTISIWGLIYLAYAVYLVDLIFNKYHLKIKQSVWMLVDILITLLMIITELTFEVLKIHVRNLVNSPTGFSLTILIMVFAGIYSLLIPSILKKKGRTS